MIKILNINTKIIMIKNVVLRKFLKMMRTCVIIMRERKKLTI